MTNDDRHHNGVPQNLIGDSDDPYRRCAECARWERIAAQLEDRLQRTRWERDAAVCKAGKLENKLDDLSRGNNITAQLRKAEKEIDRLLARIADLEEGIVR